MKAGSDAKKKPVRGRNRLSKVFKGVGTGFVQNKLLKLSAALAYYTVFSMGPLLVIIISLCSIFFGREAIEGRVYTQLQNFLGHDAAIQLQSIIRNAAISGKGKFAAFVSGTMLLIGATTIFAEIQESINIIWGLKPKPKKGWLKLIQNRFLSFSIITSLGFLLLVSLVMNAIIESFGSHVKAFIPGLPLIYLLNLLLTLFITSLIFGIIFKVLPDAKIRWKDIIAGALVTAVLFMFGKFAISFYISSSSPLNTIYGTAGSLVILLLWIYYSAIILYLGAEFTRAYALEYGSQIYPSEYAVTTKMVEVETGKMHLTQRN